MKKKNYILNGMILFYCIAAILFSLWFFAGASISLNQPKTIDDNEQLITMLEQNIPVRIYISNGYWGGREITSKQQVFSLWERINNIPQAVLSQETSPMPFRSSDTINGSVVFLNGDTDFFEISNYIRRNGLLYGDSNTSFEILLLYDELESKLYTLENLEKLAREGSRQVLIGDGTGKETALNRRQRSELSLAVRQCTQVEGREYSRQKGELKAIIKLYLEKEGTVAGERTVGDLIWIAVYENGYAEVNNLQMGAVLQIKGTLSEYCLKILEQHSGADGAE